jgi:hypothetical protein
MTQFVSAAVPIPAIGRELVIDGNSKISGWENPTPNALSLPAPATCPGSTATCRATCYASTARTSIPDALRDHYESNLETIRSILAQPDAGFVAAVQLSRWIAEHCKNVGFRWHVSGDVFSEQYAWWVVVVALVSPDVQHWIYTRTLNAVPILINAPNLEVNVSADVDNYGAALAVADRHGARLCYLATPGPGIVPPDDALRDDNVIFPDYALRGRDRAKPTEAPWWAMLSPRQRRMVCPADFFGQSARCRCGVCTKCGPPRHLGEDFVPAEDDPTRPPEQG